MKWNTPGSTLAVLYCGFKFQFKTHGRVSTPKPWKLGPLSIQRQRKGESHFMQERSRVCRKSSQDWASCEGMCVLTLKAFFKIQEKPSPIYCVCVSSYPRKMSAFFIFLPIPYLNQMFSVAQQASLCHSGLPDASEWIPGVITAKIGIGTLHRLHPAGL